MGDPKWEGVETRLSTPGEHIEPRSSDKARRETSVADIQGIEAVVIPPRALVQALEGSISGALCEQKMQIVWPSGPWRGMPITGYCAEPLCITEGVCTGPRFVPHIDQWTTTEPRLRSRRSPEPREVLAAVRLFAKKAAAQTHREDERTDREVLGHVKAVWIKTIQHIRGKGDWRPGSG